MNPAADAYRKCLRAMDTVAAHEPLEIRNGIFRCRAVIGALLAAEDANAALAFQDTPPTHYRAVPPQGRTARAFLERVK